MFAPNMMGESFLELFSESFFGVKSSIGVAPPIPLALTGNVHTGATISYEALSDAVKNGIYNTFDIMKNEKE